MVDGGEGRAGWTRHLVQGLDTLPWKTRQKVRARIDPSTLDEIESSLSLSWLPLRLHVEVMERTRDVLGEEFFRKYWGERTAASLDMPLLFGKVATVVVRRFGGESLGFVKMVPMSFRYVVRDAGTMSAEVESGWARLIVDDFPRAHPSAAWSDAWVGALEGLSKRLVHDEATVEVEEHEPQRGRFVWRVEVGAGKNVGGDA